MVHALRQAESFDPSRLQHLTAMFTGGAPHPESKIREWLRDGISIVDGFGMSEAGTVFGMPVDSRLIDPKAGCVGVPTPRVQARLVDAAGNETATGVAGDLQLRGDNVFCGYWRLDEEYRASMTEDGRLVCGYHGMQMDADGSCAGTETIRQSQEKIFTEDLEMLESQQRNLSGNPDRRLMTLNIDAGGAHSRKLLDRLIAAEERASTTTR